MEIQRVGSYDTFNILLYMGWQRISYTRLISKSKNMYLSYIS